MTRMVVQQSHTQEYLGSLPMPGNGHRGPMIAWAARQIAGYATAQAVPLARCVARADGEHGVLAQVDLVAREGLSFLTRCADYRFLKRAEVKAVLLAGTTVRMTHADSGVTREVFDVPAIPWSSPDGTVRSVRLVVTRSTFPPERKHRIGHRVGNDVFELFTTDRSPASLHAADVVAVFLQRGEFEAALAQEERELPSGHWASNHLHGQRLWHLLAQWVWNLRIWLGARATPQDPALRCTDFTTDIETLATPVTVDLEALQRAAVQAPAARVTAAGHADAAVGAQATCATDATPRVAPADAAPADAAPADATPADATPADATPATRQTSPALPATLTGGVLRFRRDAQGKVHCPADHPMTLIERRLRKGGVRERFEVAQRHCEPCVLRQACRGEHASFTSGRRLDVPVGVTEMAVVATRNAAVRIARPILTAPPATSPAVPTGVPAPGLAHRLRRAAPAASPAVPTGVPPTAMTLPPTAGTTLRWLDAAATTARTTFQTALRSLRVGVTVHVQRAPTAPDPGAPQTRARRAHRRRTHDDHLQRNLASSSIHWNLRFHGLPPALARHLEIAAIP